MKKFGLLALCILLASCESTHTTQVSQTNSVRSEMKDKALAGDREAQFQLGNSFCCGDRGFLDTREAIRWWCLAALQEHPGAITALKKHDPRKTCPI